MYSELSFFEGAHFQHIADYLEHLRLRRRNASLRSIARLPQLQPGRNSIRCD